MLVFLDQEKVYDQISHDFLQKTLTKLKFPTHFRKAIHAMYQNAKTVVIINGAISDTFNIKTGVRQGDPLSCLLFNIAIETLANLLRKSNLEGFKLTNKTDRLITTLFADDTTVYLSKYDNFRDLESILKKWCRALGAKFNVNKTEIIPVGPQHFRDELIRTKRTRPHDPKSKIPNNIKIAKDGEPVRALGAFVGNKIVDTSVWSATLETLDEKTNYWLRSKPSLEGRAYLTKVEPGGQTQYRTMVQGMPKQVEK